MEDSKAWRVAISSPDFRCEDCGSYWDEPQLNTSEGDYCPHCQYAYCGYTDIRSDYADTTVGYFPTEEEADAVLEALRPHPRK